MNPSENKEKTRSKTGLFEKFYFQKDIIPIIIEEIKKAEKFIKIAIFQIHNERIFAALEEKLPQVKVEILTLPEDSIHAEYHDEVVQRLTNIEKKEGKVDFIRWNVGDIERTTAAILHWYSYHGKFIVTDKAAVCLSANLTTKPELDALIILREKKRIDEFLIKFKNLKKKFVKTKDRPFGTIKDKILQQAQHDRVKNGTVFQLPRVIESETHKDTWIKDYPPEMCPEKIPALDGLFFAPFDCRGRALYEKLILEAKQYVYISTETFTDSLILFPILHAKLRGLDVKIITGYESMDFPLRVQNNLIEILSFGIEARNPGAKLHAKLLISEKKLVISSINLNKMGLGFKPPQSNRFWRENTETFYICTNNKVIEDAKGQFLSIFNESEEVSEGLILRSKTKIGNLISKAYSFRSSADTKELLSKINFEIELKGKKKFGKLIEWAIGVAKHNNRKTLKVEDIKNVLNKRQKSILEFDIN